jgi:hypothetical protein
MSSKRPRDEQWGARVTKSVLSRARSVIGIDGPPVRSPIAWILLVVGVLHAVGIGWGLPASDGWDNDGVAPRDFLPGLAATVTPGRYYTYPPVHLALLAVLTSPVTVTALARARSLAMDDVVREILNVPYMTAMAYVARVVALVMSLGIVVFVARLAEEIRAAQLGATWTGERWSDPRVRRAGWCAAAVVGIDASLTYYGKTSNLDVPYLFWATWSILVFTRALARHEPRLFRRALLLAVLAVGTKDQAYGLFLLSYPAAFALFLVGASWARQRRASIAREAGLAVLAAIALLSVVDCVIFNPQGFAARVAFLTGSASQDYVEYSSDWSGRLGILEDAARTFHYQYPSAMALAMALGLVLACAAAWRGERADRGARLAVALLPLLAAISFTIAFNFTARRTDPRFLLPQAVTLAVYGGLGIEAVVFAPRPLARVLGRAVGAVVVARGVFVCASVDVNLLRDPRYDAEAWLEAHVEPGDTIETYGLNVYLPRMPRHARVIRVGPEPVEARNPLPGVEELQARFEDALSRPARWIVVSTGWVWRYLIKPELGRGRQLPPTTQRTVEDEAATRWFNELVGGSSPFAYAHISEYDPSVFPAVDVHGTSARTIWIYERRRAK